MRTVTDLTITDFVLADGYAIFRPVGQRSLMQGIEMLRDALARANAQRIAKLMIVITEVSGYEVPSLSMRASMMRAFAAAAGGWMSIALVCRPEFIDPQKFGVRFGESLGMVTDVFETEDEAVDWLRSLD